MQHAECKKILSLVLLLLALTALVSAASAASVVGYIQTTANLVVRSKTSASSTKLTSIPNGTKVAYYSTKTVSKVTWYKVTYNKKTGWVNGNYVKKVTAPAADSDADADADTVSGSGTTGTCITVKDGSRSMQIYPAEKIDWYTGGISTMIARGTTFKIYDVKTGHIWTAYRQAGGDHMDIEPATAVDTKILCSIYGVSSAAAIAKQNLWQRRPCLVTVNGHTYACSLYGIPHGQSTISTNNMNGQVCLHFTNSKTHGTKRVDSYHKEAIEYALSHAPNGRK